MTTPADLVTCPICGKELGQAAVVGPLIWKVRYCPTASSGKVPAPAADEMRTEWADGHVAFARRRANNDGTKR